MGRNLSPAFSQELENLGKDPDSRKSAMKALKSYMKDLDSKAIPLFLAKVSETKNAGSSYGEYTISLYEVLARSHGPKIVSQLESIMNTIIKTLRTSGGSFPLQQACSKVVPAIARYGIEPTMPEDEKRRIIHSLCKPLSDSLLRSQESLSCGAALCLKALVDSDNWRFASNDMVNEVCLKLTGALKDTSTQTNSHMGLVMSLAKRNSFVVEAYAPLLVNAGLHIVNCGLAEKNSQKRLTAVQMVHSLMKCLDIRCILSELDVIIEEMEKCQSDQLPFVKGAAFEALQTAKKLLAEKRSKLIDSDVISMTGSNFGRSSNSQRRNFSSSGSGSPESQTLDSFPVFDESYMATPMSTCQASCNVDRNAKNLSRKLWGENGGVDISLKDGLFSKLVREGSRSHLSSEYEKSDIMQSYGNGFPGFVSGSFAYGGSRSRSQTPSPQRTNSQRNVDSIKIFTTPRKLLHSLQDDDDDSNYFESQLRERLRFSKNKLNDSNGNLRNVCDIYQTDSESESQSESESSTENMPVTNNVSHEKFQSSVKHSPHGNKSSTWKSLKMFLFIILLIASVAFATILWPGDADRTVSMIPT